MYNHSPRTQPTTFIVLCSPMGYPDFYPPLRRCSPGRWSSGPSAPHHICGRILESGSPSPTLTKHDYLLSSRTLPRFFFQKNTCGPPLAGSLKSPSPFGGPTAKAGGRHELYGRSVTLPTGGGAIS